jgi:glutamyl-Q tRNA(Asp) synthetase
MQVVSRFAPSPTGRLHLGHAYSALLAHHFARSRGGGFVLRIEDIDATRSRPEHVAAILEDLAWLGIDWDGEPVFQSERLSHYAAALDRLKAMRLVYPCFCTRAEVAAGIAASVTAPHGPDGPVYPGICRELGEDEGARRLEQEPHAWRLDMAMATTLVSCPLPLFATEKGPRLSRKPETNPLSWTDNDREIPATPEIFGDVVLARKDAPTSYHLAVTVDDAAQGITDIVRGRDLFPATHIHRLLQALLDLPVPAYHHHDLLLGADGRRLAKRHGAPSLADLRAGGVDGPRLARDLLSGRLPAGYSYALD